MKEFHI